MKNHSLIAGSVLLACAASAFAEGFYFQGGGGAGFVNGNIDEAGTRASSDSSLIRTPVIDDASDVAGAWFVGLGYMYSDVFGLEGNYIGYTNTNSSKSQAENGVERTYDLSTEIYQINIMGVARTPLEVGFGFFVKAKAGVAYTDQHQDISASDNVGVVTYLNNNQVNKKFSPVLGIGIENDVTDIVSISLEYLAAINNEVENSMVYLGLKFKPFDVIESFR